MSVDGASTLLKDPNLEISMIGSISDTKMSGKIWKLLISMLVNNISIFLIWGASSTMLNIAIQKIVGLERVEVPYGITTAIGSAFALVAQPVAGALSDRARSRFGRRAPSMFWGALFGLFSIAFLGIMTQIRTAEFAQIALIIVGWCLVQVSYNFVQGPLSAVFPDRVPIPVRGTFSGILGMGLMIGSLGGSFYASAFIQMNAILAGFIVLGCFCLVMTLLFIVLNPDRSSKELVVSDFHLGEWIKRFWVSPRKYSDFWWALGARFFLMLGYFGVMLFQVTILQKYLQPAMSLDEAVKFFPMLSLISMVGTLITMPIGGRMADKLGRFKMLVIGSSLVLAVSLLFPLLLPTQLGMICYAAVAGVGFGCYMAVDTALITLVLPSSTDAARDLGIINVAATLPQVLGPAVAGGIAALFGYHALFIFAVAFAIIGAVMIYPIKSVK